MPPNGRPDTPLAGPPAGSTTVTATHRLARARRRDWDRQQAGRGLSAWPTPDILPLDAWLHRLWESALVAGHPLGDRRLLRREESRFLWKQIVQQDAPGPDAGLIGGLASSAWRLCQTWQIPVAQLVAAAETADHRAFAGWAVRYGALLDARRWTDEGRLLAALGDGLPALPGEAIAELRFAGFYPWTPDLETLATRLRAAGTTVSREADESVAPGPPAQVTARDDDDELCRALAWAADRLRTDPGADIAILVPDLERQAGRIRNLGLNLLAPGWQLRENRVPPVSLSGGRTLTDYPVVDSALRLLDFTLAGGGFAEASILLRSPYWAGGCEERAGRARAELRLRQVPLNDVGAGQLAGIVATAAPDAAVRLRQMARTATAQQGAVRPASAWAKLWSGLLATAGWPGDRSPGSEEYQATAAWQELLEAFAASSDVLGPLAAGAALATLRELARERAFEPESVPGSVQVIDMAEAAGQQFDGLWICGMTAERWPPSCRLHPLVPVALQRAVGIPDASPATLRTFREAQLGRLVGAAPAVTLSWARVEEGAEVSPSPLLAGLVAPPDPVAPAPSPPDPHPDRSRIAASARLESVPSDPPPAWPGPGPVSGGTGLLTRQATCPARAFIEYRLRGRELEAPARPLDRRMRGILAHALLERLFAEPECRSGLQALNDAELAGVFTRHVDDLLRGALPGQEPWLARLRDLERQRLWLLLQGLKATEEGRTPFQVLAESPREMAVGPLLLGVRPDRVDALADGRRVVLDYKTGQANSAGWARPRLTECQLPAYALALEADGIALVLLTAGGVRLRGVGAEGLAVPGIATPARAFRGRSFDWAGLLQHWRTQLTNLALEFVAGDFRLNPADPAAAAGQFAALTRVWECTGAGPGDEPEEAGDD